jgi:hypothetical protein
MVAYLAKPCQREEVVRAIEHGVRRSIAEHLEDTTVVCREHRLRVHEPEHTFPEVHMDRVAMQQTVLLHLPSPAGRCRRGEMARADLSQARALGAPLIECPRRR